MSSVALPSPLPSRRVRGLGIFGFIRELLAAVREGQELATRYKLLAYLSDEELTALGLKREDIPRVVVSGWAR